MSDELLDYKWLSTKFDQLKVESRVTEKVLELESDLNKIFYESLNYSEWNIESFFTLMVAFHFVNDLLKGQYIDSQCIDSIEILERNRGVYDVRHTLLFCDVNEVKSKALSFYSEKIKFLREFTKTKGISSQAIPLLILELIEAENSKLFVPKFVHRKPSGGIALVLPKLAKQIRCRHFALDTALVDQGRPYQKYSIYNMEQMKELFGAYHGRLYSEDNIITDCITTYSFGVYLQSDRFKVKDGINNIIPRMSEVDDSIKMGNIDTSFNYPYEGLVRLYKDFQHPWLKESALKYLLRGGIIKILNLNKRERLQHNHPDRNTLPFLLLEPSFSEYVLGETKLITIRPNESEIKITFKDLLFVQHEVHNSLDIKDLIEHKKILVSKSISKEAEIFLSDDNLSSLETGIKVKKNLKKFSKDGAAVRKKEAFKRWQPLLDLSYKKVMENPEKKWSGNNLAETMVKDDPSYNKDTFRKKLSSDKRIKPFLNSRN